MIEYVDELPARTRGCQMRPRSQVNKDLVEFFESGERYAHVTCEANVRVAYVASYSYAKRHALPVSVVLRSGELYFMREDA